MRLSRVIVAITGVAAVLCLIVLPADALSPSARPSPIPLTGTLGQLAGRDGIFFGTAVNTTALANEPTYNARVGSEFTSVTPENVMKWDTIEPQQGVLNFAPADALVAFARAHNQRIRGHNLVWHNQIPSWLTTGVANGSITPSMLLNILHQHITDEVTHFRGKLAQWDVVNEALNDDGTLRNDIWLQNLGPGYIADAFTWAHQADPHVKLFYNDFNLESVGPKSNAALALVEQLRSQGVHVDGVGIQGHLDTRFPAPGDLAANMKRFSDAGFQTEITEADVRMPTPSDPTKLEAQAEAYRVMVDACLVTRRCTGVTVWGFTDLHSWVPGTFPTEGFADVLDLNYQPKPAYDAIRTDLVLAAHVGGDRF